jgi:hypothetical protein
MMLCTVHQRPIKPLYTDPGLSHDNHLIDNNNVIQPQYKTRTKGMTNTAFVNNNTTQVVKYQREAIFEQKQ